MSLRSFQLLPDYTIDATVCVNSSITYIAFPTVNSICRCLLQIKIFVVERHVNDTFFTIILKQTHNNYLAITGLKAHQVVIMLTGLHIISYEACCNMRKALLELCRTAV